MMFLVEVALLGVALVYLLYKYGTKNYNHWKERGVVYKEPAAPFIGNGEDFFLRRKAPADSILDQYNYFKGQRFGGLFQFRTPALMIRDPEIIKNVLVKDFDYFVNRNALVDPETDPLFGRSLLSIKDQQWKDMRSTLSPAFTSAKMKAMFKLINNCGAQVTEHLEKLSRDQMESKHADGAMLTKELKGFFTRFTSDIIATTAFGVEVDSFKDPDNEFYKTGNKIMNFTFTMLFRFLFFLMFPSMFKWLKITLFGPELSGFFRKIVHGNIKEREEKGIVRPDMIQLMLQARKGVLLDESDPDSKIKKLNLTDDDITSQAILFFLAGFETASTNLSFTGYELAVNPETQKKLQEEVDAVYEADGGFTYDGVMNKMKYLDMVINESLRKWPPGLMADRIASKRYVIPATDTSPEVVLEKDSVIWVPFFAIHRDPEYWPEPEKFDPERFSEENKDKIHPYTYLPFGSGPRNCIGSRFALMESKLCLVHIIRKFSFKVVPETQIPLKLSAKQQGALVPEKQFWVGIEPRSTQ